MCSKTLKHLKYLALDQFVSLYIHKHIDVHSKKLRFAPDVVSLGSTFSENQQTRLSYTDKYV